MKNKDVEKLLQVESLKIIPDVYEKVKVFPIGDLSPVDNDIFKTQLSYLPTSTANNTAAASGSFKKLTPQKKVLIILAFAIFACAAILGIFIPLSQSLGTVYFDLNPSISVEVNYFGVVTYSKLLNADAKRIFGGEKFVGKSLEGVVKIFMEKANKEGLLDGVNSLTLSVKGKSKKSGDKLLANTDKKFNNYILGNHLPCPVEKPDFDYDDDDDDEKEQHKNVSPAKLQIIKKIMTLDTDADFDELADMSVKELRDYLKELEEDLFGDDID